MIELRSQVKFRDIKKLLRGVIFIRDGLNF